MKFLKIIFLFFLLFACDNKEKEQTLIVGTAADNPPYEFIQNGEIVGFDIDLIKAIAKYLNKKIIIKNFDFNGLLAAVVSENIDVVIAALSIDEERAEYLSFSDNYSKGKLAILHRAEDNIKTFDDLNSKVVGVQHGSTWEKLTHKLASELKINSSSNNLTLVEELKAKNIDAIVLEEYQSKYLKEHNPGLTSHKLEGFDSNFAIAMSKDSGLIKEINMAIDKLKKDGTINQIMKKWMISQ